MNTFNSNKNYNSNFGNYNNSQGHAVSVLHPSSVSKSLRPLPVDPRPLPIRRPSRDRLDSSTAFPKFEDNHIQCRHRDHRQSGRGRSMNRLSGYRSSESYVVGSDNLHCYSDRHGQYENGRSLVYGRCPPVMERQPRAACPWKPFDRRHHRFVAGNSFYTPTKRQHHSPPNTGHMHERNCWNRRHRSRSRAEHGRHRSQDVNMGHRRLECRAPHQRLHDAPTAPSRRPTPFRERVLEHAINLLM